MSYLVINGERSALMAPSFSSKLQRTCAHLLKTMWDNYSTNTGKHFIFDDFLAAGQKLRIKDASLAIVNVTGADAVRPNCLMKQCPLAGVTACDIIDAINNVYLIGCERGIGLYCNNRDDPQIVMVKDGLFVKSMQFIRRLDILLILGTLNKRPKYNKYNLYMCRNVSQWLRQLNSEKPTFKDIEVVPISTHAGHLFACGWFKNTLHVCFAFGCRLELLSFVSDGDDPFVSSPPPDADAQRSRVMLSTDSHGRRVDPVYCDTYRFTVDKEMVTPAPVSVLTYTTSESRQYVICGYKTEFDLIDADDYSITEVILTLVDRS